MQRIVLALAFLMGTPGIMFGQDVVINARRVNITSAQQDAESMARSGVLRHCGGTAGGRREGIGFSSDSPDAAMRNCCYYGRYRIVEKGVARGPRGWFAVIRYE